MYNESLSAEIDRYYEILPRHFLLDYILLASITKALRALSMIRETQLIPGQGLFFIVNL
jgi:hypothetical protein